MIITILYPVPCDKIYIFFYSESSLSSAQIKTDRVLLVTKRSSLRTYSFQENSFQERRCPSLPLPLTTEPRNLHIKTTTVDQLLPQPVLQSMHDELNP